MKVFKKSFVAIMTFVFVLAGALSTSNTALAETKPSLNSTSGTVFLYTEDTLTVQNIPGGLQKISWSSSNNSVLKVKSNSKTGVEATLLPKKTGSVTVTCTVETLTKDYTLTCDIKVKKASPFSKIYIDGKNNYKGKTSSISFVTQNGNAKVSAKVKKGWSLVSKQYEVYNTATNAKALKNIPKNGKVPVGKYQTKVYFTARNNKNEYFTYSVVLKKKNSETAKPKFAKKTDTIFLKTKDNAVEIKNFPSGASAVWTSSNTTIATVKKGSEEGIGLLNPKKKGKTTISCVVTKKDGSTTTISYALEVKAKVKPLEAVEIDGDNIISKTSNNYYKFKTTDHSVLVQSYERKGWTITSETYTMYKTPSSYSTEQKITGKGKVEIGTYKSVVTVKLKNKQGAIYTFTLDLFNSNYKK